VPEAWEIELTGKSFTRNLYRRRCGQTLQMNARRRMQGKDDQILTLMVCLFGVKKRCGASIFP
jgi:hypothetical protein